MPTPQPKPFLARLFSTDDVPVVLQVLGSAPHISPDRCSDLAELLGYKRDRAHVIQGEREQTCIVLLDT